MENQNNEEITIDLLELLFGLWKNKVTIVLTTVFCALAVMLGTKLFIEKQYTSTTSLYVLSQSDASSITSSDITVSTQLTSDYAHLVTSTPVLQQTISLCGLENMTIDDFKKCISVTTPTDTRILEISVTYNDPLMAKQIADTLRVSVATQIVSVMNVDAVNTVEEANLPLTASAPSTSRNGMIGAVIGFLLSAGIVVIQIILDDTIKTPEDVEKHLGLTVLGSIPVAKAELDESNGQKLKLKGRNRVQRKRANANARS